MLANFKDNNYSVFKDQFLHLTHIFTYFACQRTSRAISNTGHTTQFWKPLKRGCFSPMCAPQKLLATFHMPP